MTSTHLRGWEYRPHLLMGGAVNHIAKSVVIGRGGELGPVLPLITEWLWGVEDGSQAERTECTKTPLRL